MNIRNATKDDAEELAFLLDLAGEGLPSHLWRRMAEGGQDPETVGRLRAAREEGSFSYRNARIAEIGGVIAGMELSYRLPDAYDSGPIDDFPDVVRPLVELEAEVPGSWYINAIATYARFRGRGVATTLLSACQNLARAALASRLSLIVASENRGARALYSKLGYLEVASRPLLAYPGGPAGGEWLLMVKELH